MKSLVLSFCLIAAAVCAPTTQYPGLVSRNVATGTVNPSTLNCIPSLLPLGQAGPRVKNSLTLNEVTCAGVTELPSLKDARHC